MLIVYNIVRQREIARNFMDEEYCVEVMAVYGVLVINSS